MAGTRIRQICGVVAAIYLVFRCFEIMGYINSVNYLKDYGQKNENLPGGNKKVDLLKTGTVDGGSTSSTNTASIVYSKTVASMEQYKNGAVELLLVKPWKSNHTTLNFTFPLVNTTMSSRFFITADIRIAPRRHSSGQGSLCIGTDEFKPVCTLQLGATISNVGRIKFAGSSNERESFISVQYLSDQATEISLLDFIEYPFNKYRQLAPKFHSSTPSSSNKLIVSWESIGIGSLDLRDWDITIVNTLTHVPSPLKAWDHIGISNAMVKCAYFELSRMSGSVVGLLQISNDGNDVVIHPSADALNYDNSSSTPDRLEAITIGVKEAVNYAKAYLNINPFPDLQAIVWPEDDAKIPSVTKLLLNRYCVNNGIQIPPIFSQNRFYSEKSFVVIPDFSYFSNFSTHHDHGTETDEWFPVVSKESTNNPPSSYYSKQFEQKSMQAVYRGKSFHRDFGFLREKLWTDPKCTQMTRPNKAFKSSFNLRSFASFVDSPIPFLNSSSYSVNNFLKRETMCQDFACMLTLPGNGVWSWASKFNLLCNSVSLLVPPDELNGECWESRASLGLRAWVHYLPITVNSSRICENIEEMVTWVRNNHLEAKQIADRGREFAIVKLNKAKVLKDFARLLLEYASRNASLYHSF